MPKPEPNFSETAKLRQSALSMRDNEGRAVAVVHQQAPASSDDPAVVPIRDVTTYILPDRANEHPLTIRAAAQMINLIERADQFGCT